MRKSLALCLLVFSLGCVHLRAQQIPAAIDTDPPANKQYAAAAVAFQLPSHGAALNALMYVAAGAGPHPAVILLHGFPGNEKNLDLAQAMRRAGWDVLYFNYRGSWGSPGDFSFVHCMEDVASGLSYLRDPANAAKLRVDPKRIVLIGHSMGGFMAAYGGSHDPGVLAVGMISAANLGIWALADGSPDPAGQAISRLAVNLAREGVGPLSGCTAEGLAREMLAHRTEWDFDDYASALATRPVLVVSSEDGLAGQAKSFADAARQHGNKQITERHFPTDHAYSDQRIALEETVLNWLAMLP